jgi:hypothetical protein
MLHKVLWKSLLVTPALMGAALIANSAAIASEAMAPSESAEALTAATEFEVSDEATLQLDAIAPAELAQVPVSEVEAPAAPVAPVAVEAPAAEEATTSVASLEEIMEYGESDAALGQVTSISQLSDVLPTDWAFQALQSLVERYGCIAGYPDGTYRGRNFMTRYEFAAGLNACMDRVSELIAAGLADAVTREDLATLQRLQEEFAAELATLRGRVDALEARVSELEANQFSTTTKLRGEVIFALSAAFGEDDIFSDQVEFSDRVRLNFDTSFTGEDRLRTRFQARNVNGQFQGDPVGFSFGGNNGNDFTLDDLVYTFPVGDRVAITIGANSIGMDDYVTSTISPVDNSAAGSVSNFGYPAQYYQGAAGGTAGIGAIVQFTDNLSLDFGYSGAEPTNNGEGSGIFNGNYDMIAQLTFLSDFVDGALTYANAYSGSGFNPLGIYFDDGVNGVDGAAVANTYATQINFKFADGVFNLGGGVAFTDVSGIGANEDYDVWSWQIVAAINDLGGDGNQLGILTGVPPYTRDLAGQTRDTAFLAELFYRYRLNNNILLTPSLIWLSDPYNNNDIDDTFIGTLRTTFEF